MEDAGFRCTIFREGRARVDPNHAASDDYFASRGRVMAHKVGCKCGGIDDTFEFGVGARQVGFWRQLCHRGGLPGKVIDGTLINEACVRNDNVDSGPLIPNIPEKICLRGI